MKRLLIALSIIIILSGAGFAIKVEKLPFMSDFHIGLVNGIGMGINLGLHAIYPVQDLRFGLEVEQIMSDVNYTSTLNATRFGVCAGIKLYDNLSVFYHMGGFNFMPSVPFTYIDSGGQTHSVDGSVNYKGNYWAVSIDYLAWDFILTPIFINNTIYNQGSVKELDINIGKSFNF
ncbi:MAG: hypothetical protein WC624_06045 [Candidatus Margulisiibacteriota bacterium]